MGSGSIGGQGEGIHLSCLKISPPINSWFGNGRTQGFLQEQLRNAYDLKEGQIEQQRPGLMREAERFFILQQIDTLWREHLQAMDALRESVGSAGLWPERSLDRIQKRGLRHVPGDDDQHAPQCDLFDVHVPACSTIKLVVF